MNQILSVPNQVGLVLRAARKSAGLSQKALAARLGLSQNRLSELETSPGTLRVDQLLSVLAALGLELQVQPRGGAPVASGVADGSLSMPGPSGRMGPADPVEW